MSEHIEAQQAAAEGLGAFGLLERHGSVATFWCKKTTPKRGSRHAWNIQTGGTPQNVIEFSCGTWSPHLGWLCLSGHLSQRHGATIKNGKSNSQTLQGQRKLEALAQN